MKKQGMQVATVERKSELAFHHTLITYLFCPVFEEYADVYLGFHGLPGSGDAMRKLAKDGFGEALNGSYTAYPIPDGCCKTRVKSGIRIIERLPVLRFSAFVLHDTL